MIANLHIIGSSNCVPPFIVIAHEFISRIEEDGGTIESIFCLESYIETLT